MLEKERPESRYQFTLKGLMCFTTLCSVGCAMYVWLDYYGVATFFTVVLLVAGLASVGEKRRLCGMAMPRMTLLEFLVLEIIVLLPWAIILPSLQSGPHPRRLPPTPAFPQTTTPEATFDGPAEDGFPVSCRRRLQSPMAMPKTASIGDWSRLLQNRPRSASYLSAAPNPLGGVESLGRFMR